jgi:hypothetical protein
MADCSREIAGRISRYPRREIFRERQCHDGSGACANTDTEQECGEPGRAGTTKSEGGRRVSFHGKKRVNKSRKVGGVRGLSRGKFRMFLRMSR